MRRAARPVSLALVALLALSGCSRDDEPDGLVLDGRPRLPDAEGVVTAVSRERLTLDGGRSYDVSPKLQAFSARTLQAVPVLQRKGQYVQVGVEGDTVVWLASIGDVLDIEGGVAFYVGDVEAVDGDRLTFADGTVLRLKAGVDPGPPGRRVRATIDADDRVVSAVEPLQ